MLSDSVVSTLCRSPTITLDSYMDLQWESRVLFQDKILFLPNRNYPVLTENWNTIIRYSEGLTSKRMFRQRVYGYIG